MVDAHHHLWDPARRDYPWMSGLTALQRPYTEADLRAAAGPEVAATVLVQTVSSAAETAEFLATATESDLVAGVVGWLDLTAPDLAVPDGPLVGVRHQVEDEPDPTWLLRPEVVRGLRRLARAGLVYDLLVRAPQRPAALTVARQVPDLTFVLDHAGKPGIAVGEWQPWASWIADVAQLPNVVCKLSGLVTEADWTGWTVTGIRPYAEHVLAAFGADRVMFGSDWPVCELAGGYAAVLGLTREVLAGATATERAAVLGDTARRVYLG
ncbi:amidohydrolase family protein [Actinophytocola sp.]|uniref:amidohydrolase family protein n=1 Tax=Actinophytocola sp. TaxID=1872138 RepID=UPI002D81172D|nr:amidohydrolase family protein [Actinophytocola sp.]HET9143291.1 amidohydrolase family protein [Actinophytocola sp.]